MAAYRLVSRSLLLLLALGGVASCGLLDVPEAEDFIPELNLPQLPTAGGEAFGGPCESSLSCRFGLSCLAGVCGVAEPVGVNGPCVGSAECDEGLICAPNLAAVNNPQPGAPLAVCVERGDAQENEICTTDLDCADGLRCSYLGFTGFCGPDGDADFGQPCEATADCQAPLACTTREDLGLSEPACFFPVDLLMPNVACTAREEDADLKFYFEVPGDEPVTEFYRLPFPNDIRFRNGRPDLSGHHNPGPQYLGGDVVAAYIDHLETGSNGFSTNPTVFFRSNRTIDFDSVRGGGDSPTLFFRNIDPDSPGYGQDQAMGWFINPNNQKFICSDSIAVRPSWGRPLAHNTTYAVWLTNGVTDASNSLPVLDTDFTAVISPTRPSDARLAAAWDAYTPLRDYLATESIGTDALLTAAVFTTGDPDADVPAIRTGVRAQARPTLRNVTRCDAGVTSPCDDGTPERACSPAADGYVEVHATLEVPVWQAGTRPHLTDTDGGNLEFSQGAAVPQGTESLCVSMIVPDGEAPEQGWPVVLSAHGTGGSFLSHLGNDSGPNVTAIGLPGGDEVRMASVSIDGVQHANRRGGSELSAETLFYNFLNPLVARGNVQQGAADYFMLAYLFEDLTVSVPDLGEVRFDPTQQYFFGHSQGATVGSLMLPFEPAIRGAILSGAGGSLTLSLLNKTSPEDIASAVDFALTDGQGEANQYDPLLALLQWWIDPVDPLNVASQYWRSVTEGDPGTHVFMSYGIGDTFTPEPNMQAFGEALGVRLGTPAVATVPGWGESPYPVSGNVATNGEPTTAVGVTGQPAGFDGHFIVFRDAEVRARSLEFLGTAVRDGVPTVSQ